MFLRNYDNFMAAFSINVSTYTSNSSYIGGTDGRFGATSTSLFEDGQINQMTTAGTLVDVTIVYGTGSSIHPIYFNPAKLYSSSICLGDGNTAVTYDDYKLSGNLVTNNLVPVSNKYTYDSENKKWKRTLICTYTNSKNTNITISEWGMYVPTSPSSNYRFYSNNSSNHILTFREVLDEPIVIEPGTSATIEFTIDVPMANHP